MVTYGHVWSRVATQEPPADTNSVATVRIRNGPSLATLLPSAVGGVVVGRSTLTQQAVKLESLCSSMARRLALWMRNNPDVLPAPEWVEVFRYYQAALVKLLAEQRERARLVAGELEQMPVQSLEAQFREELVRAAHALSDREWAELDRVRTLRTGPGRWVQEAG